MSLEEHKAGKTFLKKKKLRKCELEDSNCKRLILSFHILLFLYPQSSSTLWNYSKCGVYTVESEAGR
jgi:hypothetical protein